MSEEYYEPVTEQDTYNKWEKETTPRLKEEFGKRIVSDKWYNLMRYTFGLLLIGILILGYAVYTDKFKTEIPDCVCPDVSCPEIEIPECPSCPAQTCTNACEFPDEININLKNNTD